MKVIGVRKLLEGYTKNTDSQKSYIELATVAEASVVAVRVAGSRVTSTLSPHLYFEFQRLVFVYIPYFSHVII